MGQFLSGIRARTAQEKDFRNGALLKKPQNTLNLRQKTL